MMSEMICTTLFVVETESKTVAGGGLAYVTSDQCVSLSLIDAGMEGKRSAHGKTHLNFRTKSRGKTLK